MKTKEIMLSWVVVCLTLIKVSTQNIHLIKDYLNYTHIKTALFATCDSTNELLKIVLEFHNINTYANVWSIKNDSVAGTLNNTQFFVRLEGRHVVVVDLNCEYVSSFLDLSSPKMLFHLERSWLMFSESLEQSYDILAELNINVDADVTLAIPLKENIEYQLSDVYNPSKLRGGHLNITTIGKWDIYRGIQLATQQTKIQRRHDLGGLQFYAVMTLPSAIPDHQTFLEHVESNEFTQLNSLDRSSYKMFKLIMEMHNFTVFLHRTQHWLTIDSNGRWTGTLGMVQRGEVDVAITGARHQENRYGQVETTMQTYYVQIKFIFQHPKTVNSSNVFLSPLNDIVWLLVFLFALFIAVSLRQTFLLENNHYTTDFTYSNSILAVFGMMFQQGYGGSTNRISSKLLTITVLFFSIILFQFYSSFIISSLLIEPPKTIKTMSQLLQSKLKCIADDVPYILDILKYSKDESAKEIYQQIQAEPQTRVLNVQNGLALLKQQGYAFNTDASYAYPKLKEILSDKEICNLQEVAYIRDIPCYPMVPVKSPLKELIKISLTKFRENGIMSHHWDIWIGKKPRCQKSKVEIAQMDWAHFSPSLCVLLIGIVTSFVVLSVEMFDSCYHRTKMLKECSSINVW